jgi:hypothetical protein
VDPLQTPELMGRLSLSDLENDLTILSRCMFSTQYLFFAFKFESTFTFSLHKQLDLDDS